MAVPEPASRELLPTERGPTYRIEKRRELMRENSPRVIRRAFVSICLTWLVLLALAAFQGFAVGHRVPVPFLRDIALHARFILAVPLLLLAENIVGPRLAHAAVHFITSGVVIEQDFSRFDSAVGRALALCDSTLVRFIFVVLAYTVSGLTIWSTSVHISSWSVLAPVGICHLPGLDGGLGNSFAFVEKMKLLPIGSRVPVHLALALLIPMSPLLLTIMPLNDILKRLFDTVL
jgi:hypothetical protein